MFTDGFLTDWLLIGFLKHCLVACLVHPSGFPSPHPNLAEVKVFQAVSQQLTSPNKLRHFCGEKLLGEWFRVRLDLFRLVVKMSHTIHGTGIFTYIFFG